MAVGDRFQAMDSPELAYGSRGAGIASLLTLRWFLRSKTSRHKPGRLNRAMAKDRAPAATAPGDPARSAPPRGKPPLPGLAHGRGGVFVDFIAVGFFSTPTACSSLRPSHGVWRGALMSPGPNIGERRGGGPRPFFGAGVGSLPHQVCDRRGHRGHEPWFLPVELGHGPVAILPDPLHPHRLRLERHGGLATAKLVANWFDRGRGMALGVATMGISLSGVLMPVLSALLVEAVGWRGGFLVFGAFTALLVLPVTLRFVISSPEHLGLAPDGDRPSPIPAVTRPVLPTRGFLRDRNFWMLTLCVGCLFCCMSATLTHMVPRVSDLGYTVLQAAPILSFGAAAGVLGRCSLAIWWIG